MSLTAEQQALEQITRAKRILVASKENPSLDALAAAAACSLFLKKMGKEHDAVVPGFVRADAPTFLPGLDALSPSVGAMRTARITLDVTRTPLSELMYDVRDGMLEITVAPKKGEWSPKDLSFKNGGDRYDLVIALDCPDMASLGTLMRDHADFLHRTTVINVDRDPGNEMWGQVNLADLNAVATCEVLYGLFKTWNRAHIDGDVATALLAGMIARTKSFRTPNVTPRTLASASELVACGGRREEIVQGLWRTRTVPTLKLWGRALSRLEHDRDRGLVWSVLTRQDFVETGASDASLDGVVDELIAYAPEAKVVALIHEPADAGPAHVSLHANPPHSAADLGRPFDASGTRERATFRLPAGQTVVEGTKAVVDRLRTSLKPAGR